MSFNIALSGVNAAQKDLDTTANNIANVNTVGFKESRAEFGDVFASSLLGGGNRVIMFKINKNNFLVVSNKNSISNILPLNDIELAKNSEQNL